jgi:hypothetical protein
MGESFRCGLGEEICCGLWRHREVLRESKGFSRGINELTGISRWSGLTKDLIGFEIEVENKTMFK